MSRDFRSELYKRYDSTYKIHISNFNEQSIQNMWKWFDKKYLPLLSSYSKESPILELGCGRGYMLEYLKKNGFSNLKGIDISEEQIDIASKKGFNVAIVDANEFLQKNESQYKIIIALDFVEHFYREELLDLFSGIYTSMVDGGVFIFHTPNGQTILTSELFYGDLTHLTILTPNSAQQILRSVGFNKIYFFEAGPVSKNIKGFIRLILWNIVKLGYNLLQLIEGGTTLKIVTRNFIGVARK